MDRLLTVLCVLLHLCATGWTRGGDDCPSSRWNAMCRPCCEYSLIRCRCPSKGSEVGYTVPCCRNALDQCDPCIVHPGCSLFENCKTCNNGTWRANDDFFVDGKYCTECRQGWSGGDCRTCGGVIRRAQGHVALESYPTNARCEWTLHAGGASSVELRFSLLSLEPDHGCRHDYVEVRDGEDSGSPVIGRFCGDELPPPVRSSGNSLHVRFSSDGYNNFDGFVLTFQESSEGSSIGSSTGSSGSTGSTAACSLPVDPADGYLEPVRGPENELLFVNYWCRPPFILSGAQQRTCLPNGTWSGAVPSCVKGRADPVRCAAPPKLPHGFHKPATDAGTVEFFCRNSYVLRGTHRRTCLSNGSWSGEPPRCVRACREPRVSELVRQSVAKPRLLSRFSVQDVLSAGFVPLLLDMEDRDDGGGGGEFPRGFHPLHTSIEYTCASPLYRNTGSSRRTCLRTGRWSGRHVSCSPVCGRLAAFSRHALSDTRWPWHVAVYVRSAAAAARDQQGASASEDGWRLACSGALLAQRGVLAAARCLLDEGERRPLRPAHVKVVVGMQHRGTGERLQHLRVSDVILHPNFYPGSDSDLAVLKLKDKAKVSERSLPVCLPAMQGGEVTAREAFTASWTVEPGRHRHRPYTAAGRTRLVRLSDAARCERASAGGEAVSDNTLCVVGEPSDVFLGVTVLPAVPPSPGAVPSGLEDGLEDARGDAGPTWQLLGLETFVQRSNDQQTYTLQTKVANFRDWIEENVR